MSEMFPRADDYELSPKTVKLLQLWREGTEKMQRNEAQTGNHGEPPELEKVLKAVHKLNSYHAGLVVIDLLTLLDAMEQAVTLLTADRMEKSLGGAEDPDGGQP